MRSRYSAYATANVDYIVETHDPEHVKDVDRASTEIWAKQSTWLGLEITHTERGEKDDDVGVVEFVARYKIKGATINHRERAEFRKHNGRWVFVDGQEIKGPPIVHDAPRPGRNDLCPCGSGKKYKKCCAKAA
jgi:SEC-C motif-containing protein